MSDRKLELINEALETYSRLSDELTDDLLAKKPRDREKSAKLRRIADTIRDRFDDYYLSLQEET